MDNEIILWGSSFLLSGSSRPVESVTLLLKRDEHFGIAFVDYTQRNANEPGDSSESAAQKESGGSLV